MISINSIKAFKDINNMYKLKIDEMSQYDYEGTARFQIMNGNEPSQKYYTAHYNADPDEEMPYKKGDIVEADLYINSNDCKKTDNKKFHLTSPYKNSDIISAIVKITKMLSDRKLRGKTNDINDDIAVFLTTPVLGLNNGDVVEINGNLEVSFD